MARRLPWVAFQHEWKSRNDWAHLHLQRRCYLERCWKVSAVKHFLRPWKSLVCDLCEPHGYLCKMTVCRFNSFNCIVEIRSYFYGDQFYNPLPSMFRLTGVFIYASILGWLKMSLWVVHKFWAPCILVSLVGTVHLSPKSSSVQISLPQLIQEVRLWSRDTASLS